MRIIVKILCTSKLVLHFELLNAKIAHVQNSIRTQHVENFIGFFITLNEIIGKIK